MKTSKLLITLSFIFLISCSKENRVKEYNIDVEELLELQDFGYKYNKGSLLVTNNDFQLLYDCNNHKIGKILKIDTLKKSKLNEPEIVIDTTQIRKEINKFLQLSNKYKIGHIVVDRQNKVYFSSKRDIPIEYIYALNDSVNQKYLNSEEFEKLENGWFKIVE